MVFLSCLFIVFSNSPTPVVVATVSGTSGSRKPLDTTSAKSCSAKRAVFASRRQSSAAVYALTARRCQST